MIEPWSNVRLKTISMALDMLDNNMAFFNDKKEVCVSSGTNPMYYRPYEQIGVTGKEWVCDPDETCPAYKFHYRTAETGIPCKHIVAVRIFMDEWPRERIASWASRQE